MAQADEAGRMDCVWSLFDDFARKERANRFAPYVDGPLFDRNQPAGRRDVDRGGGADAPSRSSSATRPALADATRLRGAAREGCAAGSARIVRFDFHPTTDGWRISEANCDVPSGFIEASAFARLIAAETGYRGAGDPAGAYADAVARGPGAVVALLYATAYTNRHGASHARRQRAGGLRLVGPDAAAGLPPRRETSCGGRGPRTRTAIVRSSFPRTSRRGTCCSHAVCERSA